ncbi:hypothetical protein C8J57DRAFT_1728633 [Mycena rebaudengoi]|nr:hypothetical protein C8J57DRAFT_1728633 [Mycena rebaudengoi]
MPFGFHFTLPEPGDLKKVAAPCKLRVLGISTRTSVAFAHLHTLGTSVLTQPCRRTSSAPAWFDTLRRVRTRVRTPVDIPTDVETTSTQAAAPNCFPVTHFLYRKRLHPMPDEVITLPRIGGDENVRRRPRTMSRQSTSWASSSSSSKHILTFGSGPPLVQAYTDNVVVSFRGTEHRHPGAAFQRAARLVQAVGWNLRSIAGTES